MGQVYYHWGDHQKVCWVFDEDMPLDQLGGEYWSLRTDGTIETAQSIYTQAQLRSKRHSTPPEVFRHHVPPGL